MFDENNYSVIKELFQVFADEIQGVCLFNKKHEVAKVMKDDVLLEFHFGSRDEAQSFLFLTPIQLRNSNFYFKKKKELLTLDTQIKTITSCAVYTETQDDNTIHLLETIFNDIEYISYMEKLGRWKVECFDNTLMIRLKKSANPIIGQAMTCEELAQIYEFLKETKKTIEFYINRV